MLDLETWVQLKEVEVAVVVVKVFHRPGIDVTHNPRKLDSSLREREKMTLIREGKWVMIKKERRTKGKKDKRNKEEIKKVKRKR